jgi:hypothetical protein
MFQLKSTQNSKLSLELKDVYPEFKGIMFGMGIYSFNSFDNKFPVVYDDGTPDEMVELYQSDYDFIKHNKKWWKIRPDIEPALMKLWDAIEDVESSDHFEYQLNDIKFD